MLNDNLHRCFGLILFTLLLSVGCARHTGSPVSRVDSIKDDRDNKLADQKKLAEMFCKSIDKAVLRYAMEKLHDPELIHSIATRNDLSSTHIQIALEKEIAPIVLQRIASETTFPEVREKAILKLLKGGHRINDQELLKRIFLSSKDEEVLAFAVRQINDQEFLSGVVFSKLPLGIRTVAADQLDDQEILYKLTTGEAEVKLRRIAIHRLSDQSRLKTIALHDKSDDCRGYAVERIDDQELLYRIVFNDQDTDVQQAAAKKLTDQNLLKETALNHKDLFIRSLAIPKISNQDVLFQVAEKETNLSIWKILVKSAQNKNRLYESALRLGAMNCHVFEEIIPELEDDRRLAGIYEHCVLWDKSPQAALNKISNPSDVMGLLKNRKLNDAHLNAAQIKLMLMDPLVQEALGKLYLFYWKWNRTVTYGGEKREGQLYIEQVHIQVSSRDNIHAQMLADIVDIKFAAEPAKEKEEFKFDSGYGYTTKFRSAPVDLHRVASSIVAKLPEDSKQKLSKKSLSKYLQKSASMR